MIKAIIFDFGDVFINLDKKATECQLRKLGVEISPEMIRMAERYEVGEVNTDHFVSHFTGLFPDLTSNDLISAWNAIILDFPEYRLEFIEQLAAEQKYQCILLSNTNALHIEKVKENMTLKRFDRFRRCFDKFYLSHEIGFRKPNTDIFQFVLKKNQLGPRECLFIDDTKEHTVTASNLGMHTWHLMPNQDDVIQLFNTKAKLF